MAQGIASMRFVEAEKIRQQWSEGRWGTRVEAALACGLSPQTLSRILNRQVLTGPTRYDTEGMLNEYFIDGGTAHIRIHGVFGEWFETLVDADDIHLIDLPGIRWRATPSGYERRNYVTARYERRLLRMHRVITGVEDGLEVDHKNNDAFDNRRCNLRPATPSQNQANRHALPRNTSGYRGVTFVKKVSNWQASIKHNGYRYHLGCFATPEEAAHAYNVKAIELFGDFARPNTLPTGWNDRFTGRYDTD